MPLTNARVTGPILAAVMAAVVAGCGSGSSHSSTVAATSSGTSGANATSAAASAPHPATTATTRNATASAAAATQIVITTKHDKKLGTILAAGDKRLTVYLWQADHGGSATCTGPCAAAWPPVIGTPTAAGSARTSELGTVRRADGRMQVTYKGHPLYFFIRDKDDGDAYGEGSKAFGADWYVLRPSGNKVDES